MQHTNKKIAINSLYLYLNSIFQLIIGLYTSRILLQVLGVEDFGIYGVVGGIVALLGFINMAMSSASSRYIIYELAHSNIARQRTVFSTIFMVHCFIALITFILAETIGLWYVAEKLVIPVGREMASHVVYQISILMAVVNILQVPYTASITAHEKMGFLSLWNSLNILLKLLIILLVTIASYDKLIFYSILMLAVTLFIGIGFVVYCKRLFKECSLARNKDILLLREILSFAGFNGFTSFSTALRTQGTNLLLNRFFGVIMNSASSISSMTSGYIISFSANIITAFRPQIVKSYATKDYESMLHYMNECTKYCLGMFSLLAIPIFLEMDYVLKFWLHSVPEHTSTFCRFSLVGSIFGLMNMVVLIGIQATSYVKRNSLYISIVSILSIAILALCFFAKMKPYFAFLIYAITEFCIYCTSLYNIKTLIRGFDIQLMIKKATRVVGLIIISAMTTRLISFFLDESFVRFILTVILYTLIGGVLFIFLMVSSEARSNIKAKIQALIRR
ncbi:MAG: hypothetical protein SOZ07_02730 [Prevotella sp.]|nr:hypothetical protein [Prevotellaceae bacterium]MDY3935562.1 hypothetical protein [Prevotella sp.]